MPQGRASKKEEKTKIVACKEKFVRSTNCKENQKTSLCSE